ncbi:MAG: riboflavin biosynthesis protein RibF [Oscillospiraceae bacterium]|jgi:riboflavin kinase/FMN adenylyltransferase|nr:riboflavin biosynthesis protein RibF [Oscillospiraceae bacterium]
MTDKKRCIALGFFDGVHIGHAALLRRVVEVSKSRGLIPSVLTFDAHPRSLVTGRKTPLICSPEDRAGLISRLFGIDDVIFVHFDEDTLKMSWREFLRYLLEDFGARHLVFGRNFRFGYRGEGTAELLAAECARLGIGFDVISEVLEGGLVSSSTHIRELLTDGNMREAVKFLGHPYVLTDFVRFGFRLGRTIGTPTVNMRFSENVLIPAFGVYCARVYPDTGGEFFGVTNIGTRPTVAENSDSVTAETYILDFRGNLYGHTVRIELYEKTRGEQKFSDITALKERIALDVAAVREYFGK